MITKHGSNSIDELKIKKVRHMEALRVALSLSLSLRLRPRLTQTPNT